MSEFHQRLQSMSPSRLKLLAIELHDQLEKAAYSAEPIAILGLGCRFPGGAHDADSYWNLLCDGKDAISEVPPDRWQNPEAAGDQSHCRLGAFLGSVDRFDADFFGLTPREVYAMDPQQRLLLEVVWEALEDANLAADRVRGSLTGVFIGAGSNDYSQLLSSAELLDGYALTGNALNALAGRISYFHGWRAPSLVVDTACSSSLVAVHLAAISLLTGESEMAVAGGVNLMLDPTPTLITSKLGMLAKDGRCKAFDASADGFVRGEGCGVVVLKLLKHAQRDGDRVIGILRSSAVNQDGTSTGFTVPNLQAQKRLLTSALQRARLTPSDIDYVEAHGTGTALGDPIELQALNDVLGQGRKQLLPVGAVKANLGHLESAAGIAGLIKAIMVLRHRTIPRQLNFETPTTLFPWDSAKLVVPRDSILLAKPSPLLACVSSFGVSGTNASVILEEAAPALSAVSAAGNQSPLERNNGIQILLVSAQSAWALQTLIGRYADALNAVADEDLGRFCLAANLNRSSFSKRAFFIGTRQQILSQLRHYAASPETTVPDALKDVQVAFLCRGSGYPAREVCNWLRQNVEAFGDAVSQFENSLVTAGGSVHRRLFELTSDYNKALNSLEQFAFQFAMSKTWQSVGITASAVVSERGGEIVAACLAGCLDLAAAINLVASQSSVACDDFDFRREQLTAALSNQSPKLGWFSCDDGKWIKRPSDISSLAKLPVPAHSVSTVMDRIRENGLNVVVTLDGKTPSDSRLLGCNWEANRHADDYHRELLHVIGALFVAGIEIRLHSPVAQQRDARRQRLPAYPFERKRFWPERVPSLVQKVDACPLGQLQLIWQTTASLPVVAPSATLKLVGVFSPRPSEAHPSQEASPEATVEQCVHLMRALQESQAGVSAGPFVLITRHAWRIKDDSIVQPQHAALWGLARVFMSENSNADIRLIDVPFDMCDDTLTACIQQEIIYGSARQQVAYRDGQRYVARLGHATDQSTAQDSKRPFLVRTDGTYLITGGSGGLGRIVSRWLLDQGAGRLVILSRREVASEEQQQFCATLKSGQSIEFVQGDVINPEAVQNVLTRCGAALKGIFHLAGVVDDALISQQTADRFQRVFAPKAKGAWNLHNYSQHIELDCFVVYSSASAVLGTPGQSNYAAANAYVDSLSQLRRARSLPALSVQWGPWRDKGMTKAVAVKTITGIDTLDSAEAMEALESALRRNVSTPTLILKLDAERLPEHVRRSHSLLAELAPRDTSTDLQLSMLEDVVEHLSEDEAIARLKSEVAKEAAAILRRDQPLPYEQGFFDAGMDSLMALELSNRLQARMGNDHPLAKSLLFDYPNCNALGCHLAQLLSGSTQTKQASKLRGLLSHEPIAIVGIGCRFPGEVRNPREFWELLMQGRVAVGEIPRERWEVDDYYDPDPNRPGKMVSRDGGFLNDIDLFEPGFFGISPKEAVLMDPQQRLLLEVTWQTMEDAGLVPKKLPTKDVGVFVGISSNDYLRRLQDVVAKGDPHVGAGNALSAAAGRISYFMGWNGPAMAVDTACSSSLVALHLAIQSLRDGRCSLALAGGVNLVLSPESNVQLTKAHMLAPDGRCKVFDEKADGYVRGEGCAMVAVKRLSDALRDQDKIWSVIRGCAINQDGQTAGLTVPSGPAQEAVIRDALADALVVPERVNYVEAHGTGTALGDPIELGAVSRAYARDMNRAQPLLIGSVKANIGHLEAAAGIAGLIKSALMHQHRLVPPQPLFEVPTSHVDWDQLGVTVSRQATPLTTESPDDPTIIGVSSFGFIGTNAHVILESPPKSSQLPITNMWPSFVLPLSAHSESALAELVENYRQRLMATDALDNRGQVDEAGAICCAVSTGRTQFAYRVAAIGNSCGQLAESLSHELNSAISRIDVDHPARLTWIVSCEPMDAEKLRQLWLWEHPTFRSAWSRLCESNEHRSEEHLSATADSRVVGFHFLLACLQTLSDLGLIASQIVGLGKLAELAVRAWREAWTAPQATKAAIECDSVESLEQAKAWDELSTQLVQKTDNSLGDQTIVLLLGHFSQSIADRLPDLNCLSIDMSIDAQEKDNSLWAALAQLYKQGVEIEWRALYPRNCFHWVDLPAYPFQRKRYWVADDRASKDKRVGFNGAVLPSCDSHPLIGARFRTPLVKDIIFQSQVTSSSPPLLNDHRVYGQPILSGPTQLSMIFDMAKQIFGNGTYVVSDMTFHHPNVLKNDAAKLLQVIVSPAGSHKTFRIISAPVDSEFEAEWTLHSTGSLRLDSSTIKHLEMPLQIDASIASRDSIRKISGEDFYRDIEQVGFTFGPTFQWIEEMQYVQGHSIARMRARAEEDLGYGIAPGLADSCFQSLAAATGFEQAFAEDGDAYVPFMLKEVRMYATCENASYCRATLRLDHGIPDMTVGDWVVVDEAGLVLVEATGLHLRRAPRESLFRTLSRPAAIVPTTIAKSDWSVTEIHSLVTNQAMDVLGLSSEQTPMGRDKLFDLGMDSLLAVELKERLESAFGRPLPATLLFDYPTIDSLVQYFEAEISPQTEIVEPEVVVDIPHASADVQSMSEEQLNDVVMSQLNALLNSSTRPGRDNGDP